MRSSPACGESNRAAIPDCCSAGTSAPSACVTVRLECGSSSLRRWDLRRHVDFGLDLARRTSGFGLGIDGLFMADSACSLMVSEDLNAIVESLRPEPVVLFGVTPDAEIAVNYAAAWPEHVRRLILYGGYVPGRVRRATTLDAAFDR